MRRPQTTETKWAERVREWRESGESAHDFARRHGFAASTLHGWSSRLSQKAPPRFLQLVPLGLSMAPGTPGIGGRESVLGALLDRRDPEAGRFHKEDND